MKIITVTEVTNKSFEHWGEDNQLSQLQEECAELIIAVNKFKNKKNKETKQNLIDEIADVKIMLEKIINHYDLYYNVEIAVETKWDILKDYLFDNKDIRNWDK